MCVLSFVAQETFHKRQKLLEILSESDFGSSLGVERERGRGEEREGLHESALVLWVCLGGDEGVG